MIFILHIPTLICQGMDDEREWMEDSNRWRQEGFSDVGGAQIVKIGMQWRRG